MLAAIWVGITLHPVRKFRMFKIFKIILTLAFELETWSLTLKKDLTVRTILHLRYMGWKVRGWNPGGGRDFPHSSRRVLGAHLASHAMGTWSFSRG